MKHLDKEANWIRHPRVTDAGELVVEPTDDGFDVFMVPPGLIASLVALGEGPGHSFHGNQWTTGEGHGTQEEHLRELGDGSKEHPIHTESALHAAHLIAEGKYVQLPRDKVSVLLDDLAKLAVEAKAAGGEAKTYDLCKITVPDSNLFCVDTKGIPRVKMPQLSGAPTPGTKAAELPLNKYGEADITDAFRAQLKGDGYKFEDVSVNADTLKATQNELNGAKVAGIMQTIERDEMPPGRIFVSSDNYVLDGHHRWAANVGEEFDGDNQRAVQVEVTRVDQPISVLVDYAKSFARYMGIPQQGVAAGPVVVSSLAEFGDVSGHTFHGNQWSSDVSAEMGPDGTPTLKHWEKANKAVQKWAATHPRGTVYRAMSEDEVKSGTLGGRRGELWVSQVAKVEYLNPGEVIAAIRTEKGDVVGGGGPGDVKLKPLPVDRIIDTWSPAVLAGADYGHPFYGNQHTGGLGGTKWVDRASGRPITLDKEAVLKMIQRHPSGVDTDTLAAGLGVSHQSAHDLATAMQRQKMLDRYEHPMRGGLWFPGETATPGGITSPLLEDPHDADNAALLELRQRLDTHLIGAEAPRNVMNEYDRLSWLPASAALEIELGDSPGHEFHGNQWTEGMGSETAFIATHPRLPGEASFEWQARIVKGLSREAQDQLIYATRERYAPVPVIRAGIDRWCTEHGLPIPPSDIVTKPCNTTEADEVARIFETTPDQSGDPKVQAAFDDFKRQNEEMYDYLTNDLGVKVDFVDKHDPYSSAEAQAEDLRQNNHISIEKGLGGDHTGTMTDDEYNRFRAVHDTFGHAGVGGGFDRHGEYEAWIMHSQMYTGIGRDAMSSEYHGVNSALWAGAPGSPGTGKSILLPPKYSLPPWER